LSSSEGVPPPRELQSWHSKRSSSLPHATINALHLLPLSEVESHSVLGTPCAPVTPLPSGGEEESDSFRVQSRVPALPAALPHPPLPATSAVDVRYLRAHLGVKGATAKTVVASGVLDSSSFTAMLMGLLGLSARVQAWVPTPKLMATAP